jgi:hypothetical protein
LFAAFAAELFGLGLGDVEDVDAFTGVGEADRDRRVLSFLDLLAGEVADKDCLSRYYRGSFRIE